MESSQTPVGTQELSVRYCETHPESRIEGFCEECKKFFCNNCAVDHTGHTTKTLDKFCEERTKDILAKISVWELATQLENEREEMSMIEKRLQKNRKDARREIALKEVVAESAEENFNQEIGYLEAIIRSLVSLEEKASTAVLKSACEEAVALFDLEDKIRGEFEALKKDLEDAKGKMEEIDREIEKVNENIQVLDYLRGDGEYKFDEERWTALLLMNERAPLFVYSEHCVNTTVDKFKAFSAVEKVFDIDAIMGQKLVSIGKRVKMSEPVKVEKRLMNGSYIRTSLSHQGILAVCACSKQYLVQLTDLNNGKQVEMRIENQADDCDNTGHEVPPNVLGRRRARGCSCHSLVGFYDDNVLLLTSKMPLREARVRSVFCEPTIEVFREIEGTHDIVSWTDVTLLHERRELYYCTTDSRLFSFNVDTRENARINVGMKIGSIASLTGIDCGAKIVFQNSERRGLKLKGWDGKETYTLNEDNTVTRVNRNNTFVLTTMFPSSSKPKNAKNAVFKYELGLMKGESMIDTNHLVKFKHSSIVRIYKDVFLAYDRDVLGWVIFRLVVP